MADPFLGEIQIYGFDFPPRGWAQCNGQALAINQNQALFSLLGTMYGGNGQTTFALPDIRGRGPVSAGVGPGLSAYTQGEATGTENVTLISTQIPAHTHTLSVVANTPGNQSVPTGNRFGVAPSGMGAVYGGSADNSGSFAAVAVNGNTQSHPNQQPYLTLNFCIALQGIFPSRS